MYDRQDIGNFGVLGKTCKASPDYGRASQYRVLLGPLAASAESAAGCYDNGNCSSHQPLLLKLKRRISL
jgi:hypothetical protein